MERDFITQFDKGKGIIPLQRDEGGCHGWPCANIAHFVVILKTSLSL